jgi:hypothetical protein
MADLKYDNGDTYTGESKNGKRHGKGKYTSGSTSYEGTWTEDNLNGNGNYSGEDGKYQGDFENSEKSGKGEFQWRTNDKYIGDWYKDTMNGEGQYYWPDGKSYSGFFRDGARNGLGVLKMPDGSKYEGEFRNDACEGYGKFTDANGGFYEGEWKNNMKHGKGVYTYPDGRKFDGEFVNDKKTKGYIINPDGSRIKVVFNPDGSILSSEAVNDKPPAAAAPLKHVEQNNYKSIQDHQTDDDRAQRQAGVASWLAMDNKQREEKKGLSMALSFGGDPVLYVRGGSVGVRHFQKRFKELDDGFKASGAAPSVIPYDELKLPSKWNRPDIDPLEREKYLSDKEFFSVLKMDREIFKNLPPWKRNQLKQMVKLY